MKNNFINVFVFLTLLVWNNYMYSQSFSEKKSFSLKQFDINNGYEVYDVKSILFDELGWLWISGRSNNLTYNKDNASFIIQRYDGSSFYTVKLPKVFENYDSSVQLIKRLDGQIYAIFKNNNSKINEHLFLINPQTLNFQKIELPDSKVYQDIYVFAYKNDAIVCLKNDVNTKLFKLNADQEFTFLNDFSTNDFPFFNEFIGLENHFMISEEHSGLSFYDKDGGLIKKFTIDDFDNINQNKNFTPVINNWFKKDGIIYANFKNSSGYYSYQPIEKKWKYETKLKLENPNQSKPSTIYTDIYGNIATKAYFQNDMKLSIDLKNGNSIDSIQLKNDVGSNLISRDLSKELFIEFNDGKFFHYSFIDSQIQTFLEDKSIRGMLQIDKDQILVTTELSGWFIIDINTNTTRVFDMKLKGKPYLPNQSRSVFEDDNYYWSNSDKGIIWVDKKTKEVQENIYFPIAAMVNENDAIYYGTHRQNLTKFDKQLKKNKIVISTSDYVVQDLIKQENQFYLATTSGLVVTDRIVLNLYTPNASSNDTYFFCAAFHQSYGLLLGSRSGKVYQFNLDSKTFNLIYEDNLNASIASILFDEKDNLWINTFKGIVFINKKDKDIERFTMDDGLSYFEANRYSTLITEDGHFIVGSLKGLSYFHPKYLKKNKTDANLVLTSLKYFDDESKKEKMLVAPKELSLLKNIELAPQNRNFNISYSLLGIFDNERVRYRYKLNNQDWIDNSKRTEISLFNLSAGDYILQIEALNSSFERIGDPVVLNVKVNEFFYEKNSFYTLIIVFILALGGWFYYEQNKLHRLREKFSSQIIATQEDERSRIAKELHDNIGQRLLILKNIFSQNEVDNTAEFDLIRETIKEVRNISHDMYPFQFESIKLVKSLENLMDAFQRSSNVFYSYDIDPQVDSIPMKKQLFIFRMLQECISNVEKHAEATACNLSVFKNKRSIIFQVKDNGKGFYSNTKTDDGLGMRSLHERSQYIDADLKISSQLNKGTTVIISIHNT